MNEAELHAFSLMQERKRAYGLAFGSPAGETVLKDLAPFCRADTSCFDSDPRMHAFLEGRRDVWLRINRHLKRTVEELLEIYAGPGVKKEELDDA